MLVLYVKMVLRLSNQVQEAINIKLFLVLLLSILTLSGAELPSDDKLKKMIGHMLLIGFLNKTVDKNSQIIKDINKYEIGGVILFDVFYHNRAENKNIQNPQQVKLLTSQLKKLSNKPLIIRIDQEGGKVARLKAKYGFEVTPSAKFISKLNVDNEEIVIIYKNLAKMLKENGINCNFAPVVDLAVNPENKVIYGLDRSYGSDPQKVAEYAELFMEALEDENILSVLKHFPGHGSSLGDSHKGFVDITNTWTKEELEPYKELIKTNNVKMIMTAHVFNANLDKKYPATLSYNVNTKLLRQEMKYNGVIISDDLQMGAIREHYNLKEIVTLSINSGVDILLFGNQLSNQNIDVLVDIILAQVKNGDIKIQRIIDSNKRISALHVGNK